MGKSDHQKAAARGTQCKCSVGKRSAVGFRPQYCLLHQILICGGEKDNFNIDPEDKNTAHLIVTCLQIPRI